MAGRHRRTPAWRRLLLRLRRSDRAARTAALQAEVVALRATVHTLRAELDAAWESAAAATAAARAEQASRWALTMPLVHAALAPTEAGETRAVAATPPAVPGLTSIELDLRPDTARTEIVLANPAAIGLPDVGAADERSTTKAELPEAAMLDPKKDRDVAVVDVRDPVTASATTTILPERRTA